MNMAATTSRAQMTVIWMNMAVIVPRPQHKTVIPRNTAVIVRRCQKTVIWMNIAVIVPRPKKDNNLDENSSNCNQTTT
jgi:hypothetical protein